MSGDYSRVRFDPSVDLSGVLMQQGRVQLDSDWNEWVALLDRRLRAESVEASRRALCRSLMSEDLDSPSLDVDCLSPPPAQPAASSARATMVSRRSMPIPP